jgi:AcrR family transcriptional regulator
MVQVKKDKIRQAILTAAWQLYSRQSYRTTTLSQIARKASISDANLYSYYNSKLDILYAVYEPWMRRRLTQLEAQIDSVDQPLERLRLVLRTLWKEIPAEENGFVNNIVQALSSVEKDEKYKAALLDWMELKISKMVRNALPVARRAVMDKARIAHVLVMALDGYSIHNRVNPRGVADDATIDAMAKILLGVSPQSK